MMTIRQAQAGDRDEWLRMRDRLWPGSFDDHVKEIDAYFLATPANTALFVAERANGKLGGFLEAGIRYYAEGCETRNVGYIEGWYVDPDLRLQGAGRALVEAAENWARKIGCQEMASDCELDNEASFKAHLAMGYEEVARAIHFRKTLA
ncbi:MAG: GNAT family N-acetyltransferase [candidate division KSB1 bacterium]|nr:GNAT family N-acetyltransferase [candidate division KSB1 bacterium]